MPTDKQINEFATDIVDSWDLNDVIGYAIEQMEENLAKLSEEEFRVEWKDYYDLQLGGEE